MKKLAFIVVAVSASILGCSKSSDTSSVDTTNQGTVDTTQTGNKPDDQPALKPTNSYLVDKYADTSVLKLYKRLKDIKPSGVMMGHHETSAYGVNWWYNNGQEITSDYKKVTGEMPALYSWDVSGIDQGQSKVIDGVLVSDVKTLVEWAHENGGINTFCWHAYNPIDGNDSWKVRETVSLILPGKFYYKNYRAQVVRIADFFKSLKDKDGKSIPIIFRPWHEHNGNWFWWGSSKSTVSQFNALWQTTVKLLTDTLGVHNLMFAYSPNGVASKNEYLERYPGDDYVDILGFDYYWWDQSSYVSTMNRNVDIVKELGDTKNKLYAITETGYNKLGSSDFFTSILYPIVQNKGLSYAIFWRNSGTGEYYIPYVGTSLENDFKTFVQKPDILSLSDINKK